MSTGALHGKSARVLLQTGVSTAFTQQAMTDTGDHKRYKITNTLYNYFDPDMAVVVENSVNAGTSWNTMSGALYTVEAPGGNIVFAVANGATDLIRVSGNYHTMADWGAMFSWKLTPVLDVVESTNFTSNGWKEYLPSLKDCDGSCEGYWLDGSNIALVGATGRYLFSLYTDYGASKKRYDGYGFIKSTDITVDKASLIKEVLNFKVVRTYYREG